MVTNTQIEHEFRRQIYLCKGIGEARMCQILDEQLKDANSYTCEKCGKRGSFSNGHMCGLPTKVWCDMCDGCGWIEGGASLQSKCPGCGGTGTETKQPIYPPPLTEADFDGFKKGDGK